jgi:hypothetical protein
MTTKIFSGVETLDLVNDAGAGMRKTQDGYLVAKPRIARTGIQIYRGFEVDKPELETVRVYRPENEVFAPDAIRSYGHRPITNDHPSERVTADNWKKHAVGQTGDEVIRDGDTIRIPMVLMDKAAINDVSRGKRELSLGYMCKLKWGEGQTKDGETYDAIQTGITANHLAIVDVARGGAKLRIGDAVFSDTPSSTGAKGDNHRSNVMNDRTFQLDGFTVSMSDHAASVVQRVQSGLEQQIRDAAAKATTDAASIKNLNDQAAKDKETIEKRDGEIVALKKQVADAALTPQKLDKLVADRMAVVSRAKAVLGDKYVCDGRTDVEIRRAVVEAKLGGLAKEMTDAQVEGAFITVTAAPTASNGVRVMADALAGGAQPAAGTPDAAYGQMVNDLSNAWKHPNKPGYAVQQ